MAVRGRRKTSRTWNYFVPDEDRVFAECQLCDPPVKIKISGGCTSGLLKHLAIHHPGLKRRQVPVKIKKAPPPPKPPSHPNITTMRPDRRHKKRREIRSQAWKHYIPSADRNTARCKLCDKLVKSTGGSTSGLLRHFQSFHENGEDRMPKGVRRKSKMWQYFTRSEDGMSAECKLCEPSVQLKAVQGCTSGLRRHYIAFHRRPKLEPLQVDEAETKYDPSTAPQSSTSANNNPKLETDLGGQSGPRRRKKKSRTNETSSSSQTSIINNVASETIIVKRVIRPGELRRGFRSKVWNHFIRKDRNLAECKTCNALVKTQGGSTSGLIRHKYRHETGATRRPSQSKFTPMIWTHFTRNEDGVSATCNNCGVELQTSQKGSTSCLIRHFRRFHEAVDPVMGINLNERRGGKSQTWEYFIRAEDGQSARCKSCNAQLLTTRGSTSGLLRHLRSHIRPTSSIFKRMSDGDVWGNFIRSDDQLSGKCKLCGLEIKISEKECTSNLHRHFRMVHENGGTSLDPKKRFRSLMWKYFIQDESRISAKCQLCGADIKMSQGSTKLLHRHFRLKHQSNAGVSHPPSPAFNYNDLDYDDDWEPHQLEPKVLRPRPSCLFCYKSCSEPTPPMNAEISGAEKCSQLEKQLKQVFILKHLVDIPSSWCEEALIKNDGESNPDSWFRICSGCIEVVNEGWKIYQNMLGLESKMKSVKEKIKNAIHGSVQLKGSEKGAGIDDEIRKRLSDCLTVTATGEYAKAVKVENIDCNTEDVESPPWSPPSLDLNDESLISDDSLNDDSDVNFENIRTRTEKSGEEANQSTAEVKWENPRNDPGLTITWKQCNLCPTKFKEQNLLDSHMEVHEESKRNGGKFDCATCSYPGKGESDLKEHMVLMKHNNPLALFPMKYSCKNCDFVGDDIWKLRTHVGKEHSDLPKEELADQTCSVCGRKFGTFRSLLHHQRRMHPTVFGVQEEIIRCDQCEMVFSSKLHLHYHKLNTHLRVNTSMCDICGKVFTSVHYMERHKKTHGEKYMCEICGLDYSSQAVLDKHFKREHSTSTKEGEPNANEEIYKCKHCDLTSPFRLVIKRHMPTHKKEMGVQCDICQKYYYNDQGLRLHKKINHSETKEQFKCPHCCKPFSASHNINGHLKSCHVKRLIDKAKSMCSPSHSVEEGEMHSSVPIPSSCVQNNDNLSFPATCM